MEILMSGWVRRDEGANCFLSHCPELGIYSAGRTGEDAKRALLSAVVGFIRICDNRRILYRELMSRGFAVVDNAPAMHAEPQETQSFPLNVPLCLVAGEHARAAHQTVAAG